MTNEKAKKQVLNDFKAKKFESEESKLMANTKKVTIDEKEYTLQHPGVRGRLRMIDDCTDANGNIGKEKFADKLLAEVVVSPKCKLEDFDETPWVYEELMEEASSFLSPKRK